MNAPKENSSIHFYDWTGEEYQGTVKDVVTLNDDFGEFYLVTLETSQGDSRFEMEDFNGLLVGERWLEQTVTQ